MTRCPSCNKKDWNYFRKVKRENKFQDFLICKNCLLIKNNTELSNSKLTDYYKNNYNKKNYSAEHDLIFERMLIPSKFRIDLINKKGIKFSAGEKLLEIGPGSGSMLYLFEKMNLNTFAIEPDLDAVNWLKYNFKAKIFNTFFFDWVSNKEKYKETQFDWIVITHVLEHLRDPAKFLGQIKNELNKNGKLLIEIPNANNPYSDGDEWGYLFDPGHFYYYSIDNLKMMLNSLGFKIELITDSKLKPYKNILCVASISETEIINYENIKGGAYGVLKMKLIWKSFEIVHILKYLFFKNPGRAVKSFFGKI